ncbi:hypothetical protein B566_EDAN004078 [Ephemera danica]|nr:hypothetical protein B566_EDAN004078 [Ephemera danica]
MMAGKGAERGLLRSRKTYEHRIENYKYTILCFLLIALCVGISVLAISIWLLLDSDIHQWIKLLEISQFYIGVYILLIGSLVVIGVTVVGGISLSTENKPQLNIFIGVQALCFVLQLVGSGVLLAYGTRNSNLQPLMRDTMGRLMMDSYNPSSVEKLRIIQETIGCCGADGPNDYIKLKKPLPSECRDTVTGSAFMYGCVEEFTLFLEAKAAWLSALAMAIALFQVVNIVLTLVLIKLIKREKDAANQVGQDERPFNALKS